LKNIFKGRHSSGLFYGALLLLLIHAIGTLGYMYLGGPQTSWIDSFYMTFITVATIGFGEVVDLSHHPLGRLFTVGLAVTGIVTMSYLFSAFVALLLESDLNVNRKKKHMEKEIAKLRGHYIVCGIGRVGSNVAEELLKTKRSVVVAEADDDVLNTWLERHPDSLHLSADAADDETLKRAGLMRAAGVFAVTGEDSQNLMISLSAKLLNPKARLVVRLHDIRHADKARRAGADEIVSPDFTGGMGIAAAMMRPRAVNFLDQMLRTEEFLRVEELTVPEKFAGTPLAKLVPKSRRYILMATYEDNKWFFNPADSHTVKAGTVLVLMTSPEGRLELERLLEDQEVDQDD